MSPEDDLFLISAGKAGLKLLRESSWDMLVFCSLLFQAGWRALVMVQGGAESPGEKMGWFLYC